MSELEWVTKSCHWHFRRDRDRLFLQDIRSATFLLAISVKNPRFSKRWLKSVLDDIQRLSGRVVMTIVDGPYIQNILATTGSLEDRRAAVSRLVKIRDEMITSVHGICETAPVPVDLISWDELASKADDSLKLELKGAFWSGSRIRDLVIRQVASSIGGSLADPLRMASFFLEEVPVLCSFYYSSPFAVIDTYPGPNADFFWRLDRGELAQELPKLSRLASAASPLTCADVALRSVAP